MRICSKFILISFLFVCVIYQSEHNNSVRALMNDELNTTEDWPYVHCTGTVLRLSVVIKMAMGMKSWEFVELRIVIIMLL